MVAPGILIEQISDLHTFSERAFINAERRSRLLLMFEFGLLMVGLLFGALVATIEDTRGSSSSRSAMLRSETVCNPTLSNQSLAITSSLPCAGWVDGT